MTAQAGSPVATISVTSKNEPWGEIVLRLFPDVAPGHVKNFVDLAKKGFYNGTTFHRVIPGFMIQGGGFNRYYAQKATRPPIRNEAANFICVNDANFLDWQYTVFGEVQSGLDVVDKVVGSKRDGRDNPLERVEMTVTITE